MLWWRHVGLMARGSIVLLVSVSRVMSMDFVSQEHGVPRDGPKRFERRGLNV
jgi:hypothetical protein